MLTSVTDFCPPVLDRYFAEVDFFVPQAILIDGCMPITLFVIRSRFTVQPLKSKLLQTRPPVHKNKKLKPHHDNLVEKLIE